MSCSDVLRSVDDLISSRSILGHPFYVAWERGELTRDQLAVYARTYYPHVAAFPGHLEAAIERAYDPWVRAELGRNLMDETTHPKAHHELWLDFADELGLDRSTVQTETPRPAAAAAVVAFRRLTCGSTTGALGALYAYESQQPEVSQRKMEGLRRHYGVGSYKALAYFDVHATMDTQHRSAERESLARCVDAGANADALLRAVGSALDTYWGLLDGICDEVGITSFLPQNSTRHGSEAV